MLFLGNSAVKTLVSGRRRESEQTVRVVFVLFYKTFCLVSQDILGGASE